MRPYGPPWGEEEEEQAPLEQFEGLSTDYDPEAPIAPEDIPELDVSDLASDTPVARPDPEPHVAPEFKVSNVLSRADAIRKAKRKDISRQNWDDVSQMLLAAGTRTQPNLRKTGSPELDSLLAQYKAEPRAVDPMEQERKLLEMKKLRASLEPQGSAPKFGEAERLKAYLTESEARSGMYRRSNQAKEPKVVDEEMRDADVDLKRARAEYLKKPRGKGSGDGGDGLKMTSTVANEFADFDVADKQMEQLESDFVRLDVGGKFYDRAAAAGTKAFKLNNDYSTYADSANRAIKVVGKIIEGGKLTDGDMATYLELMPEAGDSIERLHAKVKGVRKFLADIKSGRIKFYRMPAGQAAGGEKSSRMTPGGKPYARKQVSPSTGAARYLDAAGNVVE